MSAVLEPRVILLIILQVSTQVAKGRNVRVSIGALRMQVDWGCVVGCPRLEGRGVTVYRNLLLVQEYSAWPSGEPQDLQAGCLIHITAHSVAILAQGTQGCSLRALM
eukprot:2662358-Amphidinium_carterae.1